MRIFAFALLMALCSCGTIMGSGPKNVPIDSEPKGATVYYEGVPVGKTPCVVPVRRRLLNLVLRLDGHHEQVVAVGTSGNGWVFGNIIFGGIPGIVIDMVAGGTSVPSTRPLLVPLASSDKPDPGPWKFKEAGRDESKKSVSPGDAWQ